MINKINFSNEALKKSVSGTKKVYAGCGLLIGELFRARTLAHIAHLDSTSFAEHKALNEFYDSILDLTDTLAETSFGLYGRSKIITPACSLIPNFSSYLKTLRNEVVSHREEITDTNIQNILDEILSLIDHTSYLLTLK